MADASAEAPRSRLSPVRSDLLLQALREGATVKAAAARVGVSANTVYAYRRKDPVFAKQMEEARMEGVRTRPPKEPKEKKPRRQRVHEWKGQYRLITLDTPTAADTATTEAAE
jgi:transposase-like protein